MDKLNTISSKVQHSSVEQTEPDKVWLKEHAQLIEKLEAAYGSSPESEKEISSKRYFGMKFSSINLLVDDQTNCELLEENIIYNVPMSEYWLLGVSNIRSDIVPIIDFEYILSGTKSLEAKSIGKTVIVGDGANKIGFVVNELPKTFYFEKEQKLENANFPELLQHHVIDCYKDGDEIWASIDLPSFFETLTS